MKKQEECSGVNILGHRQAGIENTELFKLISKHNIEINTIIPSKCKIKEIELAPKAKLNIVTDMIALDLAKKMKKKFKTPYVFFDKHMNKESITLAYEELGLNVHRAEVLHGCKINNEEIVINSGEPSRFRYLKSKELLILMGDGPTLDMNKTSKLNIQISNPNLNAVNIYPYTPYIGLRGCLVLLEKILSV